MKELISVTMNRLSDSYVQSVSAKELYEGLDLDKSNWKRWSEKNIVNNEFFLENRDWLGFVIVTNGNETNEFAISLNFAKHLAMMAKTKKAHEYRDYFIKCEDKLRESQNQANQKYIHRQIAREEAYPMLDAFDDCAIENEKEISMYDHAREFDILNEIVLGLTAQGYKHRNSIPLHESSIRDYLSPLELEAVAFLQNANTLMLEEGDYDRDTRKTRLQRLFDKKFSSRFQKDLLRLHS
jgi:phage anti-repressor protein